MHLEGIINYFQRASRNLVVKNKPALAVICELPDKRSYMEKSQLCYRDPGNSANLAELFLVVAKLIYGA